MAGSLFFRLIFVNDTSEEFCRMVLSNKARFPSYDMNKRGTLCEKCPNTELFLVRIFLYSDWIQENTDQK